MKDAVILTAKDAMTLFLSGLGITFAPHVFLGGLILALAGASLARSRVPEQDERELWSVLAGAVVIAIIAVELSQIYAPTLPPQIVMFVAVSAVGVGLSFAN